MNRPNSNAASLRAEYIKLGFTILVASFFYLTVLALLFALCFPLYGVTLRIIFSILHLVLPMLLGDRLLLAILRAKKVGGMPFIRFTELRNSEQYRGKMQLYRTRAHSQDIFFISSLFFSDALVIGDDLFEDAKRYGALDDLFSLYFARRESSAPQILQLARFLLLPMLLLSLLGREKNSIEKKFSKNSIKFPSWPKAAIKGTLDFYCFPFVNAFFSLQEIERRKMLSLFSKKNINALTPLFQLSEKSTPEGASNLTTLFGLKFSDIR